MEVDCGMCRSCGDQKMRLFRYRMQNLSRFSWRKGARGSGIFCARVKDTDGRRPRTSKRDWRRN